MVGRSVVLAGLLAGIFSVAAQADAQNLGRDTQTSGSCQIAGIKKGASGSRCDVAIPRACKVATNVVTKTYWTGIEKSGGISCRFDPKLTDWRTRITGSCGKCEARQCTAKFTVYFDCPQPPPGAKTP
jgi:hypothetical protein